MFALELVLKWLGCSGATTASMRQAVVYQAPHIRPTRRHEVLRLARRDLLKPS